jgi:hypothetical protein
MAMYAMLLPKRAAGPGLVRRLLPRFVSTISAIIHFGEVGHMNTQSAAIALRKNRAFPRSWYHLSL